MRAVKGDMFPIAKGLGYCKHAQLVLVYGCG
jgi:hypothetical protein